MTTGNPNEDDLAIVDEEDAIEDPELEMGDAVTHELKMIDKCRMWNGLNCEDCFRRRRQ